MIFHDELHYIVGSEKIIGQKNHPGQGKRLSFRVIQSENFPLCIDAYLPTEGNLITVGDFISLFCVESEVQPLFCVVIDGHRTLQHVPRG